MRILPAYHSSQLPDEQYTVAPSILRHPFRSPPGRKGADTTRHLHDQYRAPRHPRSTGGILQHHTYPLRNGNTNTPHIPFIPPTGRTACTAVSTHPTPSSRPAREGDIHFNTPYRSTLGSYTSKGGTVTSRSESQDPVPYGEIGLNKMTDTAFRLTNGPSHNHRQHRSHQPFTYPFRNGNTNTPHILFIPPTGRTACKIVSPPPYTQFKNRPGKGTDSSTPPALGAGGQ